MKALLLYIDRWYIIPAICEDGVLRHVDLPNKEDRIWLYFYEDVNNNKVIYGKNYRSRTLNREPHYIGDIFSLLLNDEATFKRYGMDTEIREIFKASEMLDHLCSEFSEGEEIPTFVSFSGDIPYAAQKKFLKILNDNNLDIKETVVSISHLAVEFSIRNGRIKEPGQILVVSACNENLRYNVFHSEGSYLLPQPEEGCLQGYGTDLRGRALLEQIVWQINNNTHILSEQEVEYEIMRLSPNLEKWLLKMDNAKSSRPVIYDDVTFSKTPTNRCAAYIQKKTVESRTRATVSNVVDNVVGYVKDSGTQLEKVSHVVFIGNMFKNSMFLEELFKRCFIAENNVILYPDEQIADILSIYPDLDFNQFSDERKRFDERSEKELEQIAAAKREEENRKREDAAANKSRLQHNLDLDNKRKYDNAIEDARRYIKKNELDNAINILQNVALSLDIDDDEAANMLQEVMLKKAGIEANQKQYNQAILQAQTEFEAKNWKEAILYSGMALGYLPDSPEALRIQEEANYFIEREEQISKIMVRVDLYVEQKQFKEALDELETVIETYPECEDIKSRNEEIKLLVSDLYNNLITEIKNAENLKNWDEVISKSDEMLQLKPNSPDATRFRRNAENQKIIAEEVENILSSSSILAEENLYEKALEILNEAYQRFPANEELKSRIISIKQDRDTKFMNILWKAQNDFDSRKWDDVLDKCRQALELRPEDKDALKIIEKTKKKRADQIKLQECLARVNSLIQDGNYKHALEEVVRAKSIDSDNSEVQSTYDTVQQRITDQMDGLRKKITSSLFDENWDDVIALCTEALEIREDRTIRQMKDQAEQKAEIEKERINKLTVQKKIQQEKERLASIETSKRKPIGYKKGPVPSPEKDDFFKDDNAPNHRKIEHQDDGFVVVPSKKTSVNSQPFFSDDDFFKDDTENVKVPKTGVHTEENDFFDNHTTTIHKKKIITNDDFDF